MVAPERVLVIGATRGTGRLIVNRLLQDGYRVRALARDAAKARETLPAHSALEIVAGDVTMPNTLAGAMKDVDHVIFTAGVTRRPAVERWIIATEYDGVKNTLAAGKESRFKGRFLYMTSIGVTKSSPAATLLNLVKRNTLRWRRRAEDAIRKSGFDYTIVRAGFLTNSPGGRRAIDVSQSERPLAWKHRISRADVAEVFVQALRHPSTRRTTFEVVWGKGAPRSGWDALFGRLTPDP